MLKTIKKKKRLMLLAFSVVLILSVCWYWQSNKWSKDTLMVEILGPDQVDFAKDFEYTVKYRNNGTVRLEEARLIFEYPEHSIIEEEKPLWQEIILEDIYPGQEKTITFKARLIGQEGEIKTAKATISYQPKNLKARYDNQTTFTTQLKSLPLNFEFDLPSRIEPNKEFKFRLNYFSNADYPLSDLRIEAKYPAGFEFISSNPAALEQVEWDLPMLNKADGGRVEVTGRIGGNVGEEKIFEAELGMWQNGEFITFKKITRGIEIAKPAIMIWQRINGNSAYVASAGDLLHYEIFFKNLGTDILSNLSLVDTLDGNIFDLQSLKSPFGSFTLGDNSIVWDWRKTIALQFLDPQEEGSVEFWVNLKDDFDTPSLGGNLLIKNNVYLGQAQESFETKVNSKLEVVQKGFFQDEIFGNSGPIPPQVGQTTTYTINWQAKNYYNNVKNVKVQAVLPSYVQLTGKIFPEDARLTFDSLSREIVWEVGDMQVGQGVINPAPNISFQVAFVPQYYHPGQTPDLIEQTIIWGEDEWTNALINQTATSVNTTLPDDPSINGQGIVK